MAWAPRQWACKLNSAMKFFTREIWLGAQSASQANHRQWQDAFDAYRAELSALRSRLSQTAFQFFLEADVHDGELLKLQITDASRPAPLDEPLRPWTKPRNYPVRWTSRSLMHGIS